MLGDRTRGIQPMQRSQGKWSRRGFKLVLHQAKNSSKSSVVEISRQFNFQNICPVRVLKRYMRESLTATGPLFYSKNEKPLTQKTFRSQLGSVLEVLGLPPSSYPPHAFRIGAASYAASIGLSDAEIRQLGRWRSGAFLGYIRQFRTTSLHAKARS